MKNSWRTLVVVIIPVAATWLANSMTSPTAYWTGILSDVLDRYTLSELVKPRARLRALLSVASSPVPAPAGMRSSRTAKAGRQG
jgi:hypothetical protein